MTYRIHGTDAGVTFDSGEIPFDQLPPDRIDRNQLRAALADWEVFEERLAELNKDRDLGDMLIPAPVMLDSLRVMAAAARSLLDGP